jgi:cytochrome c oxidase subunit 1
MSIGLPLVGYGLIFNLWWALPGAILVIAAIFGWVLEPSTDPDAGHHDDHDDHGDDHDPSAAALESGDADGETTDAPAEAAAETEEAPVG